VVFIYFFLLTFFTLFYVISFLICFIFRSMHRENDMHPLFYFWPGGSQVFWFLVGRAIDTGGDMCLVG
jgi:hypothetical protein